MHFAGGGRFSRGGISMAKRKNEKKRKERWLVQPWRGWGRVLRDSEAAVGRDEGPLLEERLKE